MKEVSAERKQARDEIRHAIIERSKEYFKRDKSGKGYICPVCGSGSGKHGTGVTENPKEPNRFTCWRGCYENADIFQIIGIEHGLSGFADQYNKACEIFGISLDDGTQTSPRTSSLKKGGNRLQGVSQNDQKEDFTEFCKEASKHIEETDYHRGISLKTLKQFNVGFVPAWRHPNAPASVPTSPRLIIPVGSDGYLARDTRKDLTEKQREYVKQRAGHVGLFNAEALRQSTAPIWITEGELDALSVIDTGGQAVALCSIGNARKLIEAVKEQRPTVPLILALDNDKAGDETSRKIAEAFQSLNFSFYRKSLPDPYKDENEFYMAGPEKFRQWVQAGTTEALQGVDDDEARERQAFEREAVSVYLPDFITMLKSNRDNPIPAISTGFPRLDTILGGGLRAGLYFIGAVTSFGKTTLLLQIADNVAQARHGVLIFSLEMARTELMAKSLSRLTALESVKKYGSPKYAKTTWGVQSGYYTPEENELMWKAIASYGEMAKYIHITEGVGDVGTSVIRAKTERYIKYTGQTPVIIVDYAQILQAPECRHSMTDKQVTDRNVVELKRMSRDYNTPVISVSSFNRESYNNPVSETSFKESGAIEYTSDVLIGLQYEGWDHRNGEKESERLARLRPLREKNKLIAKERGMQEIQLKVLKNRNGYKDDVKLGFYPAFNYFCER